MNDQETYEETEQPHQRWCVSCDGPVDVNDDGCCIGCKDDGAHGQTDAVVLEPVPDSSPRSIECDKCGADPGAFCHDADDGQGYNHAERVEAHAAEVEEKRERDDRERGILRQYKGRR